MSIFLTLLELYSSGLKSILFYSEYQKLFLSGFLCSKEHIGKGRFFEKNHGLTPLQNVNFFRLCENFTFEVQKALFSIQNLKNVSFLFFCLRKHMIKGRFFDKNHGLTPLQNVDFFRLCENFTCEVQKSFFSIQNIKKCFFLPFLL